MTTPLMPTRAAVSRTRPILPRATLNTTFSVAIMRMAKRTAKTLWASALPAMISDLLYGETKILSIVPLVRSEAG